MYYIYLYIYIHIYIIGIKRKKKSGNMERKPQNIFSLGGTSIGGGWAFSPIFRKLLQGVNIDGKGGKPLLFI